MEGYAEADEFLGALEVGGLGCDNFLEVDVDPEYNVVEKATTTHHYKDRSPRGFMNLKREVEDG